MAWRVPALRGTGKDACHTSLTSETDLRCYRVNSRRAFYVKRVYLTMKYLKGFENKLLDPVSFSEEGWQAKAGWGEFSFSLPLLHKRPCKVLSGCPP